MRNPLTEFTGQEFLWSSFAILIVIVAAICWRRKRTQDSSTELPPLDVPDQIDPYDIAYLRGGENELARVLIVRLIERKYLRIVAPASKWLKASPPVEIQQDPDIPTSQTFCPLNVPALHGLVLRAARRTSFGKFVFNPLAFVADLSRREIRAETPQAAGLSFDFRRAEEPGTKEHRLWNCAGVARRLRPSADWYRARQACRLPRTDEYCGCGRNRKRWMDRTPELERTGVPRASQDPMELAAGLPLRRGLESVTRRRSFRLCDSFRDRIIPLNHMFRRSNAGDYDGSWI